MNDLASPLELEIESSPQQVYEIVDNIVLRAVEEADVHIAFDAGLKLRNIQELSGKGLAYLLLRLKYNWHNFDVEDTFKDTVHVELGLDPHTVDRYVKVAEMLESLGEDYPLLTEKAISTLIPMAGAYAQGYEEEVIEHMDDFLSAPNQREAGKIAREIKGDPGRSNRISLWIDDRGSLWCYSGDDRYFIGSLEIEDEEPIVKKAIERIVKNSGMLSS